jgi:hypothetical protein
MSAEEVHHGVPETVLAGARRFCRYLVHLLTCVWTSRAVLAVVVVVERRSCLARLMEVGDFERLNGARTPFDAKFKRGSTRRVPYPTGHPSQLAHPYIDPTMALIHKSRYIFGILDLFLTRFLHFSNFQAR